jgi:phage baseplate assembly protein W
MAQHFLSQPFRLIRHGTPGGGAAVDTHGGVAVTDDADVHLRDKILAVLFTSPGERVNRPDFGVGLSRAVFEPLDDLTIAALEFRVSQGLERDLGDEVIVDRIAISSEPPRGELLLEIGYRRRTDRKPRNLEIKL